MIGNLTIFFCLQLERMKNENSLIPDNHHFDSDCELLQNEIILLEEVGACIFCTVFL